MADSVSNIRLPDGSTVTVPAWASEATMEQVANYMAATNKVDQKFLELMKGVGSDVGSLQRSISDLVQNVNNNSENNEQNKKQDRDVARSVKNISQKLMETSKFFGDTKSPVSSMVKSLSDLVGENRNMPGMIDRIMERLPAGGFLEAGVRGLGVATDVAIDAALAYAGWNAAKLEQFAAAQGKIIDAGAIFYSSSQAFDELYSASLGAGVTYNNMVDTYAQYNAAMISLGGSVSSGAQQFTRMFGLMNQATDEFGDLGLSNSELLEQYAVYIDHLRLTGQTNRILAQGEDALSNSFINLQIESAALANLTSLSRTEAIQRRMQALNEPVFAMSMERFTEAGYQGSADVFAAIGETIALTGVDSLQPLLDAMAMEGSQINLATGLQDFNIVDRLDPDQRFALQTMLPGFIDFINQSVREGTLTSEEIQQELFRRLVQSHEDYDDLVGDLYLTSNDPRHVIIMQLAADARRIEQEFGALARLTPEEFRDAYAETQRALGEAGSVVVDMNRMTTTFLRIQDAATMSMSRTGEIFSELAQLMENSVDVVREMFGLDDSGFGEYYGTGGTNTGGHPMGFDIDSPGSFTGGTRPVIPAPTTPTPAEFIPGDHELSTNLDSNLVDIATSAADQLGITLRETSGLRPMTANVNRDGLRVDTAGSASGRHTGGYAVDTQLLRDGRVLNYNNPEDAEIIAEYTRAFAEAAIAAGHQPSFGVGRSYMSGTSFHYDIAAGNINPSTGSPIASGYWGDGETSDNADPWMRNLWNNLQRRRFGGLVGANIPYVVGDQLGLNSAELFMPGVNGTIVNNQNLNRLFQAAEQLTGTLSGNSVSSAIQSMQYDFGQGLSTEFDSILADNQNLQRMVQRISNTEMSNLTSGRSSAIISELRDEYSEIIETKAQSLRTMRALVDALRLINRNRNRQAATDIVNSV